MGEKESLHELVLDSIELHTDKTAVIFDDGLSTTSLSYHQLHTTAEKITTCLRSHGAEKDVVALLLKASVFTPAACLGVMSVPAAYLPVDPHIPAGLLRHLIGTLHVRCVITEPQLLQKFKESIDVEISVIHDLEDINMSLVFLSAKAVPFQSPLAYIITTSGTTGHPKIVRVPHACILSNITHIRDVYSVKPGDVVLQASPLTFDPSVVEMFTTLSAGATLLVVPELLKMIPSQLAQIISRQNVTIIQATPTLVRNFDDNFIKSELLGPHSHLRVLAFGGEMCPDLVTLNEWKSDNNTTEFYNLYGITEVSCWATVNHISTTSVRTSSGTNNTVNLGKPLMDTVLEVRSEDGNVLLEGIGQLFIGGHRRTCMINDEVLDDSTMRFRDSGDLVNLRTDGTMLYLGRVDNQIKRHGKRINLGQIEQVALSCEEVMDAVVLNSKESPSLVMCVKLKTSCVDQLWTHLRDHLPQYVLPDSIVPVENVPITRHGKVDKRKLQEIIILRKEHHSATITHYSEEDVWQCYRKILKEVLKIPDVASDKTFLELGGDSFKAVRLISIIENKFGVYNVQLMESILKDTFSTTCCLIAKLRNSQKVQSAVEDRNNLKRKPSAALEVERNNKVYISEINSFKPLNMFCVNCTRSLLLNNNNIRKVKGNVAISRGSQYQCVHLESSDAESSISPRLPCERNELKNSEIFMKLLWKYDTGKCVDASPLVVSNSHLYDGTIYIGSHSHKFSAINLVTGKRRWEITLEDRIESSACLSICQQYVILGCYDGCVYVVHVSDGRVCWTFQTGDQVKSSPTVDPKTGLVYIGSHDHHVYSLDIPNSRCVWRTSIDDSSVFSSPCINQTPHVIYAATLGGHLAAIKPETGDVQWRHYIGKPIFSSPATTHHCVLSASVDHSIYCFSHDGNPIWQFATKNHIFSSPVTFSLLLPGKSVTSEESASSALLSEQHRTPDNSTRVLVGSHDNNLYCLDHSGKSMWAHETNSPVYATPFVFAIGHCPLTRAHITEKDMHSPNFTLNKHCAVTCSTQGQVSIIDIHTGKLLCTANVPGEVFSSPVVWGDKLIVGCRDENVYCFQLTLKT